MTDTQILINYLINDEIEKLSKIYLDSEWRNNVDFEKVFDSIIDEKPNSSINNMLGLIYHDGLSIKKDPQKAFYYAKLSAKTGNSYGQFNLAWMYDRGSGIKLNESKALYYYRLSTKQRNCYAQDKLGDIYHYGNGIVPVNYLKALKYYLLSANQGNNKSKCNITILLQDWDRQNLGEYILNLEKQRRYLDTKCHKLEGENTYLRYRPGGPGFEECQERFKKQDYYKFFFYQTF